MYEELEAIGADVCLSVGVRGARGYRADVCLSVGVRGARGYRC